MTYIELEKLAKYSESFTDQEIRNVSTNLNITEGVLYILLIEKLFGRRIHL